MKPILIGCPFDNGIQMMLRFKRGITGAADGPEAVIAHYQEHVDPAIPALMLSLDQHNLPTTVDNLDAPSFIKIQQAATDAAHGEITAQIRQQCEAGFLPVAIGGDHSLTYPLCRGVGLAHPGQKLGLIYIDAHLDMRPLETYREVGGLVSSGNSFRRLIEEEVVAGPQLAAIGIHRSDSAVFRQMERFAHDHQVTIIEDTACDQPARVAAQALDAVLAETDGLYVSVDIDAVEAQAAPGVSAPAEKGLPAEFVLQVVKRLAQTGKVWGFDVVEISSRRRAWFELLGQPFDEPSGERAAKLKKTARLAAELVDCFLQNC